MDDGTMRDESWRQCRYSLRREGVGIGERGVDFGAGKEGTVDQVKGNWGV